MLNSYTSCSIAIIRILTAPKYTEYAPAEKTVREHLIDWWMLARSLARQLMLNMVRFMRSHLVDPVLAVDTSQARLQGIDARHDAVQERHEKGTSHPLSQALRLLA